MHKQPNQKTGRRSDKTFFQRRCKMANRHLKRCSISLIIGNGYPLQYSCLKNSKDRGACKAIVYGITESDTTDGLPLIIREL